MMIAYIILSAAIAGCVALVKGRNAVMWIGSLFYLLQAAFVLWISFSGLYNDVSMFFRFDSLGLLFFALMAVVSPAVFLYSRKYLDTETDREFRLYNILLILLCVAVSGVYFADNIAVTWVFMEATTLCTAGLIYHRRTERSLEATWKYLFVCSTGIAVAYLGILLLSTAATNGDLSYGNLAAIISGGNPLYIKIAFVFILVGYSCKMEIFPLYSVGIDANSSAPSPASALISTALVNAGFVSIYRVYKVIQHSPAFLWAGNVLIVAGVLSLVIGALYMRRTNNYKRFLAYSTVENMGIAVIGLGIGGIGVFAALFHITAHSLIKSGLFLKISQVGKTYGSYRINRLGGYMRNNPAGAVVLMLFTVMVLAFPPSPLFVSELIILSEIIIAGKWWLIAIILILVCVVIYNFCTRIIQLCYKTAALKPEQTAESSMSGWWLPVIFLLPAMALGIWQPEIFVDFLKSIVQ